MRRVRQRCWHCEKPLSLWARLQGNLFCRPEHERAYDRSLASHSLARLSAALAASVPEGRVLASRQTTADTVSHSA